MEFMGNLTFLSYGEAHALGVSKRDQHYLRHRESSRPDTRSSRRLTGVYRRGPYAVMLGRVGAAATATFDAVMRLRGEADEEKTRVRPMWLPLFDSASGVNPAVGVERAWQSATVTQSEYARRFHEVAPLLGAVLGREAEEFLRAHPHDPGAALRVFDARYPL